MPEQHQYNFNPAELKGRQSHADIRELDNLVGAIQIGGYSSPLLDRSMSAVESHLPQGWAKSIRALLIGTPILIRVVRNRKSKHGDHIFRKHRPFSTITVNASGNGYRFAITLLHEIAHAQVSHRYLRRMKPHGREWKSSFQNLLMEHVELFPSDLRSPVLNHAQNPLYTTDADSVLSQCLRKYDTLDLRPTVSELATGDMFSLNGRLIMTKGKRLRKMFRCVATGGRIYHVSPAARVQTVYNPGAAGNAPC